MRNSVLDPVCNQWDIYPSKGSVMKGENRYTSSGFGTSRILHLPIDLQNKLPRVKMLVYNTIDENINQSKLAS